MRAKDHSLAEKNALTKASTLNNLKEKYGKMTQDPTYTLPIIFDLLMNELELPFNFFDVLSIARSIQRKDPSPALRLAVFQRDNFTCTICGRKPPEISLRADHIIPVIYGGLTEERNLQTLCFECNVGKGFSIDAFRNYQQTSLVAVQLRNPIATQGNVNQ